MNRPHPTLAEIDRHIVTQLRLRRRIFAVGRLAEVRYDGVKVVDYLPISGSIIPPP